MWFSHLLKCNMNGERSREEAGMIDWALSKRVWSPRLRSTSQRK